jgi:hypothetical protein
MLSNRVLDVLCQNVFFTPFLLLESLLFVPSTYHR